MPIFTIPGVESVDDFTRLNNPNIEEGDIVLVEGGASTSLPFAFREAGQPIIDITMTDAQITGGGVLVVKDQTNPPEWNGPHPIAGPFTTLTAADIVTDVAAAILNMMDAGVDHTAELAAIATAIGNIPAYGDEQDVEDSATSTTRRMKTTKGV